MHRGAMHRGRLNDILERKLGCLERNVECRDVEIMMIDLNTITDPMKREFMSRQQFKIMAKQARQQDQGSQNPSGSSGSLVDGVLISVGLLLPTFATFLNHFCSFEQIKVEIGRLRTYFSFIAPLSYYVYLLLSYRWYSVKHTLPLFRNCREEFKDEQMVDVKSLDIRNFL
ncbi:hypothetical protein Ddye_009031 [Dipteronia dyeriana]|uniref:Uncharacterized protein n=1 Tax=Dipteronia dyeriana TaxID=168575 RepID=A0AAD9XAU8_9ROSI|nr:hypothetical protein Ddye_009031 [Dipteronia dyeriana]